jgi:hypothetical protein
MQRNLMRGNQDPEPALIQRNYRQELPKDNTAANFVEDKETGEQ